MGHAVSHLLRDKKSFLLLKLIVGEEVLTRVSLFSFSFIFKVELRSPEKIHT